MQSSIITNRSNKSNQQGKTPTAQPPNFTRKIGSTIYTVSVHSSQTSKETVEDKILRLIESGVYHSA